MRLRPTILCLLLLASCGGAKTETSPYGGDVTQLTLRNMTTHDWFHGVLTAEEPVAGWFPVGTFSMPAGEEAAIGALPSGKYELTLYDAPGIPTVFPVTVEGEAFTFDVVMPTTLKVMTRNLYYGASLQNAIAAVAAGDPAAIVGAVTQVYADLLATDFRLRAGALADEILEQQPHLIGLQEVALWRTQHPADGAPQPNAQSVAWDFLGLLLDELRQRGLDYVAVNSLETFDAEFPRVNAAGDLEDLRLTDREVILAHADLLNSRVIHVANPRSGIFETNTVLPGDVPIQRGWVSVDVMFEGRDLRFFSTHLDADVPDVRFAQAQELVELVSRDHDVCVVLLGDLNTTEGMPAYESLRAAGLHDAAGQGGNTCCYGALLDDARTVLDERIDLVFYRPPTPDTGQHRTDLVDVRDATTVGDGWDARLGMWASDHAGTAVALALTPLFDRAP